MSDINEIKESLIKGSSIVTFENLSLRKSGKRSSLRTSLSVSKERSSLSSKTFSFSSETYIWY